jgi:hypothetical protein
MWTADPIDWSVNSARSSVNANGLLSVAPNETRGVLTVKASHRNNTEIFGTAEVTVTGNNIMQPHLITIAGDGASAEPNPAIAGEAISLNAGIPKTGYIFGGWTINPPFVTIANETSPVGATFQMIDAPVEVTANWLRIGAVSTGGKGDVTSYDVTWLARHVAGHTGFEISNRRVANLRGEDRTPNIGDVTMLARWLVGYDLAHLN